MTDKAVLRAQLTVDEGLRLFPYQDSVGKLTIGVGRNLSDKGISKSEADLLLNNDIDEAVADCASFPWFSALDGVRQMVLVNLRFNMGPSRLRGFRRMLAAIVAKDYSAAADQLQASKWFRQVGDRGPRLVAMLRTGQL